MKRQTILWILIGLGTAFGVLIGCHAQPDDPAGQAEELSDPVRRENAVANLQTLYSNALAAAQKATQTDGRNPRTLEDVPGDDGRTRPGPKKIADASIEALVRTYVDHPEDTQNGGRIVALLREMHDPRALPAFLKALEWRAEISEDHAVTAAQAIEDLELTEEQKGTVVTALGTALERIQGNRGDDNRMRIHFIRTLRHIGDRRATPVLTKIATRMAEDQAFTINRLAAEALADLGDPAAIPTLINALFLFAPNNPLERMNDIGGQGLVQIGEPALAPTLALLRGENADATRIAQSYIRAVGSNPRGAEAASKMDPRSTVIEEACFALGQIGLRAAMDPMTEHVTPLTSMSVRDATEAGEAQRQTYGRALTCTTSLIQINREESDTPRLRQTIIDVYQRIPEEWPPEAPGAMRSQLLAAMMHTYDAGLLDFLHGVAADRDGLPDFRVMAARSYAFLASKNDVPRLRAIINAEPAGGQVRQLFEQSNPALDTAHECDADVQCYITKLGDSNPTVVSKAAYMIGRYGRGNAAALTALIEHIDHTNIPVRGDVLYAIDWIATSGSPEAVAAIDRVHEVEDGRSSWNQIKGLAMAVRARLGARGGS